MFLRPLLLERHLSHTQAAFYATLAYFLFAASDAMVKYLLGEGFTRAQIIICSSVPSVIALSAFIIRRHGLNRAFQTRYRALHIGRCLGLIGVTFFGFKAFQILPLADFYGVNFSAPFIVTIGAFFLFKEQVKWNEWLAILIGFCGVMVVVRPEFGHINIGYLYAFGAVLSISCAALIVRKIGRDENPYLFVIFADVGLITANIIPFLNNPLSQFINVKHLFIFALYTFAIHMAILIMSATYARAPAVTSIAPFQYTQIMWGSLFGYIFFHDIPGINTIFGCVVVVGCGLYVLFHHKRKSRQDLL